MEAMKEAAQFCDAQVGAYEEVKQLLSEFSQDSPPELFSLLEYGERVRKHGELELVESSNQESTLGQCSCWALNNTFLFAANAHKPLLPTVVFGDSFDCTWNDGSTCDISLVGHEELELPSYTFRAADQPTCESWRETFEQTGMTKNDGSSSPVGAPMTPAMAAMLG